MKRPCNVGRRNYYTERRFITFGISAEIASCIPEIIPLLFYAFGIITFFQHNLICRILRFLVQTRFEIRACLPAGRGPSIKYPDTRYTIQTKNGQGQGSELYMLFFFIFSISSVIAFSTIYGILSSAAFPIAFINSDISRCDSFLICPCTISSTSLSVI